jgi:hypothetical protein
LSALAASLAEGNAVVQFGRSFVDSLGSKTVLPQTFDRAVELDITALTAPSTRLRPRSA